MRTHPIRRGASNTQTVVIIVITVVLGGLLVLGCFGAILAGLMLPAVGKARDAAMDVGSAAHLRHIEVAYQMWLRDVSHDAPFSFDALIGGNYATPEIFRSPHGPVPDGRADYWFLHPRPELEQEDLGDLITGYDRAAYATRPRVPVLFGDGGTGILEVQDFDAAIAAPPNDEIDFDLPQRQQ